MARAGTGAAADKIDYGDLSAFEGIAAFSVCGWFNFTTLANRMDVFTKWGASGARSFNLLASLSASNRAAFFVSSDGSASLGSGNDTADLLIDTWYHLGGSWQPNTVAVYRNGVLRASATATFATTPNTTSAVRIGSSSEASTNPIRGSAAECAAWSAVLSASEWLSLYAGCSPLLIRPESLFFYSPLYGAAATEPDLIGGSTGTVTNLTKSDHCRVIYPTRTRSFVSFGGAGGPTYTLTADAGSFALTGIDAGLQASRLLTADVGSFALTGQDAGLLANRSLTADAGSFALTGIDAGLLAGRRITADVGEFALTGIDAGLAANRLLGADVGEFTLTGIDADLTYSGAVGPTYTLTCDAGSFALTGIDGGLQAGRLLTADAGSFALTGIDAGLLARRLVTADAGSFTLTGIDADLIYSGATPPTYTLTCDVGSFALTGIDAALTVGRLLTADTGSFVLTGNAANLVYSGAPSSTPAYLYYYWMSGA